MNQEDLEEFFKENHKHFWLLTLYDTHKKLFFEFLKEKNTSKEQIKEMIKLSKEFKRIYPEKFFELSKE